MRCIRLSTEIGCDTAFRPRYNIVRVVHGIGMWISVVFYLSTNFLPVIVYYAVIVCLPIGRCQGGCGLPVVFNFVSEVLQLPSPTP
jgi:hypothetical protein